MWSMRINKGMVDMIPKEGNHLTGLDTIKRASREWQT